MTNESIVELVNNYTAEISERGGYDSKELSLQYQLGYLHSILYHAARLSPEVQEFIKTDLAFLTGLNQKVRDQKVA
jgi:hypothetical protein